MTSTYILIAIIGYTWTAVAMALFGPLAFLVTFPVITTFGYYAGYTRAKQLRHE